MFIEWGRNYYEYQCKLNDWISSDAHRLIWIYVFSDIERNINSLFPYTHALICIYIYIYLNDANSVGWKRRRIYSKATRVCWVNSNEPSRHDGTPAMSNQCQLNFPRPSHCRLIPRMSISFSSPIYFSFSSITKIYLHTYLDSRQCS